METGEARNEISQNCACQRLVLGERHLLLGRNSKSRRMPHFRIGATPSRSCFREALLADEEPRLVRSRLLFVAAAEDLEKSSVKLGRDSMESI